MKLAESHPDMWVILSLDIAAGVENYCTKINREESPFKMSSFDKEFGYYHKEFKQVDQHCCQ